MEGKRCVSSSKCALKIKYYIFLKYNWFHIFTLPKSCICSRLNIHFRCYSWCQHFVVLCIPFPLYKKTFWGRGNCNYKCNKIIDIQEYRSLMSSSPYRRVTVEIENGNLAMVLATSIQYIGYKGLRQVYLYSVHIYGGLFTNIADWLVESWISKD